MKTYLIYYNAQNFDIYGNSTGSFIWHFKTKAIDITTAIAQFLTSSGTEDQIIQIIILDNLH